MSVTLELSWTGAVSLCLTTESGRLPSCSSPSTCGGCYTAAGVADRRRAYAVLKIDFFAGERDPLYSGSALFAELNAASLSALQQVARWFPLQLLRGRMYTDVARCLMKVLASGVSGGGCICGCSASKCCGACAALRQPDGATVFVRSGFFADGSFRGSSDAVGDVAVLNGRLRWPWLTCPFTVHAWSRSGILVQQEG